MSTWVIVGLVAVVWLVIALAVGLGVGAAIRRRDRRGGDGASVPWREYPPGPGAPQPRSDGE